MEEGLDAGEIWGISGLGEGDGKDFGSLISDIEMRNVTGDGFGNQCESWRRGNSRGGIGDIRLKVDQQSKTAKDFDNFGDVISTVNW